MIFSCVEQFNTKGPFYCQYYIPEFFDHSFTGKVTNTVIGLNGCFSPHKLENLFNKLSRNNENSSRYDSCFAVGKGFDSNNKQMGITLFVDFVKQNFAVFLFHDE